MVEKFGLRSPWLKLEVKKSGDWNVQYSCNLALSFRHVAKSKNLGVELYMGGKNPEGRSSKSGAKL